MQTRCALVIRQIGEDGNGSPEAANSRNVTTI